MNLIKLSTLAAILLAPVASASMLITYNTSVLTWVDETSIEHQLDGDFQFYSDFFSYREFQFEIAFITPDFDLTSGKEQHLTFQNPNIVVKANSQSVVDYINPVVLDEESWITFDTYSDPSEPYPYFSFFINFAQLGDPSDGVAKYGSLHSWGYLDDTYPSSYDEFKFQQDNWPYKRHEETWYFDTKAYFGGENFTKMSIQKINAPEPQLPLLLLTGLACITGARKLRRKNHCY